MIISHGRRYIFVHAPKTGGTALALALEDRAMKDDILIGDTPKAQKRSGRVKRLKLSRPLKKHSTLAETAEIVPLQELDEFFLFTLVRNPWDRLVSYYHWLLDQNFEHPAVGAAKTNSFADFIGDQKILSAFQKNPYSSYLIDAAGTERKAHYIRLEHLKQDLAPLEDHLGFGLFDAVPHANKSVRDEDYRSYYSTETAERVALACETDIERFGYSF